MAPSAAILIVPFLRVPFNPGFRLPSLKLYEGKEVK